MNSRTKELVIIAVFPAMMAATAGLAIPFGILPALTLQTLFVYLAGLLLKPRSAMLSMSIYVLLGAIGIPIFSNYRGGLEVLIGPSGGFLFGFILIAGLISLFKFRNFINKEIIQLSLILFAFTTVLYLIAAMYITFVTSSNLWLVLGGFYIYLPGDLIKIAIAIYVYMRIRSHITYEPS
jgi:biotin transport system substrate-specific component